MLKAVRKFGSLMVQRDRIICDVVIVGAGPAGLSAGIRLKQLNPDYQVIVVEKGVEVGAHIVSGCLFEPRALDELIPNWRDMDSPIKTPVRNFKTLILSENKSFSIPNFVRPGYLNNEGNYIISLSETTRWLGKYAESIGVQIYPSFPASEVLINQKGYVEGIICSDFGIGKNWQPRKDYQKGVEIYAKHSLFAEGSKGSISEDLIKRFNLGWFDDGERYAIDQSYGLGIKEVWKISPEKFEEGLAIQTLNWPLDLSTRGRGFMYHQAADKVHVGLVISLDYNNPYISPYQEFQRLKTHPLYKHYLEGGECLAYGARTLTEGGFFSVPKITFQGGMLIGDSAGFLNYAKLKGTHTAMKSGMIAAEVLHEALSKDEAEGKDLYDYYEKYRRSWIWDELISVRHIRSCFNRNFWMGLYLAALSYSEDEVRLKLNLRAKSENSWRDSEATKYAKEYEPIQYPTPDGKIAFDLLTNLRRSGTQNDPDQPDFIKIKMGMEKQQTQRSSKEFAGLEEKFCPGGVFTYEQDQLKIDQTKCLHCKACEIKTVGEFLNWITPEGGSGPLYTNM
ncbi:ETFDH_3 [Blepharisma stoltei]|uniref:Electron transfer flavoprotein-ubiquinone oxidoreductase n=1 Tax=Blepharisma stoltei TaxID=1481888 RepID=A0AAU9JU80_9CILI|nr:unnamed protein product [Blepharisma stoltei]